MKNVEKGPCCQSTTLVLFDSTKIFLDYEIDFKTNKVVLISKGIFQSLEWWEH